MDYIQHFCNERNISYDLYDSAIYADKGRNFEKTTDFDAETLKNKISQYQKENINLNIKY